MRVLIVILALAYWGVSSLASSFLAGSGGYADAASPPIAEQDLAVQAATECLSENGNDLLVAASFSGGPAGDAAARCD